MNRIYSFAAVFFLSLAPAFGSVLSITLNPALLTGNPGDELIYSGTINAPEDIFLNGVCFSFTAAPCDIDTSPGLGLFTIDTNPFYSLPGTGSVFGDIFGVVIDPSAHSGAYSGTIFLLGGSGEFDFDTIASGSFELVVSPEPSTALLLFGVAGLAFSRRWYKGRAR